MVLSTFSGDPEKVGGSHTESSFFFLSLVRFSRPGKRLQSDALKIVPRLSPLGFRDGFVTLILEKKVLFSKPGKRLERAVCTKKGVVSTDGFSRWFCNIDIAKIMANQEGGGGDNRAKKGVARQEMDARFFILVGGRVLVVKGLGSYGSW